MVSYVWPGRDDISYYRIAPEPVPYTLLHNQAFGDAKQHIEPRTLALFKLLRQRIRRPADQFALLSRPLLNHDSVRRTGGAWAVAARGSRTDDANREIGRAKHAQACSAVVVARGAEEEKGQGRI